MTRRKPLPHKPRTGRTPLKSADLAERILAAYPPPSRVTIKALGEALGVGHNATWRALRLLFRQGRANPDGGEVTSKGGFSITWRLT